jgi:hypothetical protein
MTSTIAEVAAEVTWIATAPATIEERAEAILGTLSRAVPSDAAWLALRDPERRTHIPLATAGHADPLRNAFRTQEADDEVEMLGLNRRRPPMLARELPVPLAEVGVWADHLLPGGFRGGLAAGLFTPDGRHLGFLSLLSDSSRRPTGQERDLVAVLAPLVAHAVDRMRTITAAAGIVHDAIGGAVLTRGGDSLPLPGAPSHPLLVRGSQAVRFAAARIAAGDRHATFLCPTASTADGDGLLRVTVLACARELDHLLAAVTVSPPGNLRGLSHRQLMTLGLVVDGWADPQIASALATTEHAVAEQMCRILAALRATDRTVAAVRACREGLYLPGQVFGISE